MKQKRFYVISEGWNRSMPYERAVAGPWRSKKRARRYIRQLAGIDGTRELVKAVEP